MVEQRTLGDLRNAAGLTQEELATRAGVARTTIAKLELGDHQPNLDTVRKLAAALGDEVYNARYGWLREPGRRRGRRKQQAQSRPQESAG
jgi:transcriptional regulator with XRE-family HTH domain